MKMLRSHEGALCSNVTLMPAWNSWFLLLCFIFTMPTLSIGESLSKAAVNSCSISVTDLSDDFGCGAIRLEVTPEAGKVVSDYFWYFDDGTSSSAASPRHTFTLMGPRYVQVTLNYDDGTSCVASTIVEIDCMRCGIPNPYNPEWNFVVTGACSTNTWFFFGLPNNGNNIATIEWDFGNGDSFTQNVQPFSPVAPFPYDFQESGIFNVKVTATYANGEIWECDRFVSVSDCTDACFTETCPNELFEGSPFGLESNCPIDFSFLYCPENRVQNCDTECTGPSFVYLIYTDPATGNEVVLGDEFGVTWTQNGGDCTYLNDGQNSFFVSQDAIDNNITYTVSIWNNEIGDYWQCVLCFSASDLCGDENRPGDVGQSLLDLPQTKDKLASTQIKVFPNPVNAELNISNSTDQLLIGQLTSLEGKVLSNKNVAAFDQSSIDVSNYPAGIYFFNTFNAQTKELVKSEKVVIRH